MNPVPAKPGQVPESHDWASTDVVGQMPHNLPTKPDHQGDSPPSLEVVEGLHRLLKPPQESDELGRLSDYRVLRLLGEGGMGLIFEAEDVHLGRRVALKVIRPEKGETDVARRRFLQEARAVAAIEHDHIVAIYRVGEDDGVPFLAMPLLQGESLADRLNREGALPIPEVVRIARQTAEGLVAAHASGLIHRDIKPANIFLERVPGKSQSRVKVLDFGLARHVGGKHPMLTQMGLVVGSPGYMAPEQARCEPVDARCDLFSLGCVIHRMASGEDPFKGDSPVNILLALAMDPVTPVKHLRTEVPDRLAELVRCLLAKQPADRPNSAETVALQLAAIEKQLTDDLDAQPRPQPINPPEPAFVSLRTGPDLPPSPPPLVPSAHPQPAEWESLPGFRKQSQSITEETAPPRPSAPPDDAKWRSLSDVPRSSSRITLRLVPLRAECGPVSDSPDLKAAAISNGCSDCGSDLRTLGGKKWCLRCGLCCDTGKEEVEICKPRARAVGYRVYLLVAVCALIASSTIVFALCFS